MLREQGGGEWRRWWVNNRRCRAITNQQHLSEFQPESPHRRRLTTKPAQTICTLPRDNNWWNVVESLFVPQFTFRMCDVPIFSLRPPSVPIIPTLYLLYPPPIAFRFISSTFQKRCSSSRYVSLTSHSLAACLWMCDCLLLCCRTQWFVLNWLAQAAVTMTHQKI